MAPVTLDKITKVYPNGFQAVTTGVRVARLPCTRFFVIDGKTVNGDHALGRATDADEDVGASVGPGGRDGAGDITVGGRST